MAGSRAENSLDGGLEALHFSQWHKHLHGAGETTTVDTPGATNRSQQTFTQGQDQGHGLFPGRTGGKDILQVVAR